MPRIAEVEFVSQAVAEEMVPTVRAGVISITTPGLGPVRLQPGWYAVLSLAFDDLEEPEEGAVLFAPGHADAILSWLERHEDRLSRIVVHCRAGVSRSAAVARFIADRYGIRAFDRKYRMHDTLVLKVLESRAHRA